MYLGKRLELGVGGDREGGRLDSDQPTSLQHQVLTCRKCWLWMSMEFKNYHFHICIINDSSFSSGSSSNTFSNLHHPVGNVDLSLISDELKNTAVSRPRRLLVGELEQHRVDNVQPDLTSIICSLSK